jgi:hypothetical protein
MKASELVRDASFAGLHFIIVSQDVRSELLSVKSRSQQYLQDSSPLSNDDGNNKGDQHIMPCALGRSSFDLI